MRKLLTSAAIIALLTAPALAQGEHRGGDHGGGRGPGGGGAPAAPAAAPAAPAAAPAAPAPAPAAPSGPITRGNAWQHRGPAAQPAPQAAAPAAQPSRDFNRGNDNRGGDRHDWRGNDNNRGNDRHDWNGRPGDNNRPDWNHDGRPDNRPGWNGNNNRPGNPGYRPGGRPDYSGFRDYHRNFNAARRFRAPSYHRPSGWYYRRWTYGQILPSLFWASQYWLNDYISYDLPPPPPGAVWVRYGNDAILIDRYSGEIITVQYDVFY